MTTYHYTECGLDTVFIEGLNPLKDHDGDEVIEIPAIGNLHRVIAKGIVIRPSKMSGRELRFLRTEMGLTQENLADVLKVTLLTIGRWEREETAIKDSAEMLVRLLASDLLKLETVNLGVQEVSDKMVSSARTEPIRIDGHAPPEYELIPQPVAA